MNDFKREKNEIHDRELKSYKDNLELSNERLDKTINQL